MSITQAELEVMKALWQESPQTAAEVAARLQSNTGWSVRTVKTLLSRLVDKGALGTEAEGRRYLYTPLLAQADYRKTEARRFVDRVFGGKAAPLVAHLADADGLTPEDIKDLEALIGELKDEK